jgi:hypothetical protein
MSTDLDRLRHWVDSGGTWQFEARRGDSVTISLRRCDGGEEADRFESNDPALIKYVEANVDGSGFGAAPDADPKDVLPGDVPLAADVDLGDDPSLGAAGR